jgi:hypothetical protein
LGGGLLTAAKNGWVAILTAANDGFGVYGTEITITIQNASGGTTMPVPDVYGVTDRFDEWNESGTASARIVFGQINS